MEQRIDIEELTKFFLDKNLLLLPLSLPLFEKLLCSTFADLYAAHTSLGMSKSCHFEEDFFLPNGHYRLDLREHDHNS